jgi:3-methyladenine DNA glycosylase Tag
MISVATLFSSMGLAMFTAGISAIAIVRKKHHRI